MAVTTIGSTDFQLVEQLTDFQTLRDEDGLILGKGAATLRKFEQCLAGTSIETIFEVGILRGGSTAYFAEQLKPRRLVAIDIAPAAPALNRWIDDHGAHGKVRPYYGVNQADANRIREIYAAEFGSTQIDLVIDDASHLLEETRTTFNTLFPSLRPGGLYIIEDWAWGECFRDWPGLLDPMLLGTPPLSILVSEIMVASALANDVIESVFVTDCFAAVRRGPGAITLPFDIRALI